MIDRQEIIDRNPLVPFMEGRGMTLRGTGKNLQTNRCAAHEHKPGHFCVNVDTEKQVWYCNDCEIGGSVLDFIMQADGITIGEAMKRLGGGNVSPEPPKRATGPIPAKSGASGKVVKLYDYTDEKGVVLFQVARMEPKDFRQRAPDGSGGWIYKLDGVRRVIYNLPAVIAADVVFICEGEKDADTINGMQLVGTTNCGGSKKWLPEYSAYFRAKEVVILPDGDKAGEEHLEVLRAALGKVVKSMRIVKMPEGIKDISDFAATFPAVDDAKGELIRMCEDAEVLFKGEHVPVYSMAEMEQRYRAYIKQSATHSMPIGPWLPTFNRGIRPLVPGEVFTILAGTGAGKTMLLQNLALNTNLETLLFEAELPDSLTFERFVAMATKSTGRHVEDTYRINGSKDWRNCDPMHRINCCMESNLTAEKITRIIDNCALKTAVRPVLVLIDYIQLCGAQGDSKYERVSEVAEQLKVIAKKTNTIIVVASQVGRGSKKDDQEREVRLNDGKDSGSIENSSGLVWGAWRDAGDANRMWLRVLKNTKGVPGLTVAARISDSLLIHEESNQPEP